MKSRTNLIVITLLGVGCLMLMLPGCSEKGGGTRIGNLPPDTFISLGPKEGTCNHYEVQAYWYGADMDGGVAAFEVATVRAQDLGLLDTLDYDLLPWMRTTSTESTFVLESDSCCASEEQVEYGISDWALLVRAVDNDMARDPEPANLFFQTCNVIPKVRITIPQKLPLEFMDVSSHPYIEWEADDPDGDEEGLMYKYIAILERDLNPTYPRLPSLDDTCAIDMCPGSEAPPIGKWSRWVPADCTFVRDLDFSMYAGFGTDYLVRFYVTVKDEAGAWLPENLYRSYNNGSNWLNLLIISQSDGVPIVVDGGILGRRMSIDPERYETLITPLFSGLGIRFRFWGSEDRGEGRIADAYRYYFDSPDAPGSAWNYWTDIEPLREQGESPEWIVRHPPDGSQIFPGLGQHVFVVELRDVNQIVSNCEFYIDVLESPRGKPGFIYLVDDDRDDGLRGCYDGWREPREDSLWTKILEVYNYTGSGSRRVTHTARMFHPGLWVSLPRSSGLLMRI